jgi:Cu/Ag efflux protein CusF
MKKRALVVLIALVAALGTAYAASAKSAHAMTMSGVVSAVDQKTKTFSLKDGQGKETTITWTAATRVRGGVLKNGERVDVSVFQKDGKNVATSIRISSAKTAAKTS